MIRIQVLGCTTPHGTGNAARNAAQWGPLYHNVTPAPLFRQQNLIPGTSLERIAAESLTLPPSGFVPHDM